MRLINCRTFRLEDFSEWHKPPYAILSHTSDRPEITFKDLCELPVENLRKDPASEKIFKTCEIALSYGCDYCWIDSCCIDKSNFSEWSEAVNSMFKWYQNSTFCIAYLNDFEGIGLGAGSVGGGKGGSKSKVDFELESEPPAYSEVDQTFSLENLGRCQWFSSSWTLQHLIAPRYVQFYDSQWRFYKERHEFTAEISQITNIPTDALRGVPYNWYNYSVAEIMSWASRRQTTRVEDLSYSLFGLFDIHLPLVYGEGDKAFRRLQEEIIRNRADLSILAWQSDIPDSQLLPRERIRGVLARSPSEFRQAGNIQASPFGKTPDFKLTNKGFRMKAELVPFRGVGPFKVNFVPLACKHGNIKIGGVVLGILVRQSQGHTVRVQSSELEAMAPRPADRKQRITLLRDSKDMDEGTLSLIATTLWK